MTAAEILVRVRDVDVVRRRGGARIRALSGVGLDVRRGERVALLGANGAGKTTLTHVMLGLLRPSAGTVEVLGGPPEPALAAGELGAMLQESGLMRNVRVGELITLITELYGRRTSEEVLAECGLGELSRRQVTQLSGGERQRLRLGLALAGLPRLLFLDEPTVALDVAARARFWEILNERARGGATVLFTTHYLHEAEQFADRVVVLRAGRIVADGTVDELRSAFTESRVSFRTDEPLPDSMLRGLPGVRTTEERDDGTRVLTTTDSDATLAALYAKVGGAAGTVPRGLTLTTASLEDAVATLLQEDH
ncbi:putative ABC transporter ATP-binding protein [Streptomyces formicae]|uniref:Putative ABC transporter ATP-binding protein n=1 Tax=Streptomyces formicae TaxID=1616117 RepID=A0A291Q9V4_9ACTN|nr:putative ABC transporter ATP-binding protein [Streptomyces formicae]